MLEDSELFAALPAEYLQILERHAKPKTYRRNTVIIEQGVQSAAMYVLVSGSVRVYVADDDGKEVVLNVLSTPGDHFGELGLFRDTPRTASVVTLEDSKVAMLSRQDFLSCLDDHPAMALEMIAQLIERVRALTDRVGLFALSDVYGRLVATLNEQAQEEDGRLITPRLTQQDLAMMIGASREMISRIFKELRAGDYISLEDKRIVINKKLPARW
jgi:CRP/FNR family cyclic AMP-dependent transcriptional regulator